MPQQPMLRSSLWMSQIPLMFRLSRVHRRTDRLCLCEYLYSLQRPSTPELLLPPVILTAYSPFQVYNACSFIPSHFLTDYDDSSSL